MGGEVVLILGDDLLVNAAGVVGFAFLGEDAGLGEEGDGGAEAVGVGTGDFLVGGQGFVEFVLALEIRAEAGVGAADEGVRRVFVDEGVEGGAGFVEFAVGAQFVGEHELGVAAGDGAAVVGGDFAEVLEGLGVGVGDLGVGVALLAVVFAGGVDEEGGDDEAREEQDFALVLDPEDEGIEFLVLDWGRGGGAAGHRSLFLGAGNLPKVWAERKDQSLGRPEGAFLVSGLTFLVCLSWRRVLAGSTVSLSLGSGLWFAAETQRGEAASRGI